MVNRSTSETTMVELTSAIRWIPRLNRTAKKVTVMEVNTIMLSVQIRPPQVGGGLTLEVADSFSVADSVITSCLLVIRPEPRICSVTSFSEGASGAPRRFHPLSPQRIIVYLKVKVLCKPPQGYNHCHSRVLARCIAPPTNSAATWHVWLA